jgi:hypothetical protein
MLGAIFGSLLVISVTISALLVAIFSIFIVIGGTGSAGSGHGTRAFAK